MLWNLMGKRDRNSNISRQNVTNVALLERARQTVEVSCTGLAIRNSD